MSNTIFHPFIATVDNESQYALSNNLSPEQEVLVIGGGGPGALLIVNQTTGVIAELRMYHLRFVRWVNMGGSSSNQPMAVKVTNSNKTPRYLDPNVPREELSTSEKTQRTKAIKSGQFKIEESNELD